VTTIAAPTSTMGSEHSRTSDAQDVALARVGLPPKRTSNVDVHQQVGVLREVVRDALAHGIVILDVSFATAEQGKRTGLERPQQGLSLSHFDFSDWHCNPRRRSYSRSGGVSRAIQES
jgi:hypothetical protein